MDPSSHRYMMPHFENGRFWNYPGEKLKSMLIPSCGMYIKKLFTTKKRDTKQLLAWHSFNEKLTIQHTNFPIEESVSCTWIGHASFLLNIGPHTILTDPIFNNLTPLFPRYLPPGVKLHDMSKVDVVIISHNHWDHLEKSTIIRLCKLYNPMFLVPIGDKKTLQGWGITRVRECTWWDTYTHTSPDADENEPSVALNNNAVKRKVAATKR